MASKISCNSINNSFVSFKQSPFAKTSPLYRQVKWFTYSSTSWKANLSKKTLIACASLAAIISGIGIYWLLKAHSYHKMIIKERQFEAWAKTLQRPSSAIQIHMKSEKETFNHIQEFILHHGVIWYRPLHISNKEWQPIFFDGFPKFLPKAIQADGANLIVIDNENYVHYKKIIREYRGSEYRKTKEASLNPNILSLIKKSPEDIYIAIDKAQKNNWKREWFSMPYLGKFVNLFQGKRLKLPAEARSFAISHKGRYVDYHVDAANFKHYAFTGVTTLYLLSKSGKKIYLYDPWTPVKAVTTHFIEHGTKECFEAINLSASASTIMLIGYNEQLQENGEIKKTLEIRTRLLDIDTEGSNPTLEYTYFPEKGKEKKIRVISFDSWHVHSLPNGKVTPQICIYQNGKGNDQKILQIEGWNEENVEGIWYKSLYDMEWKFQPYLTEKDLGKQIQPHIYSWVHDYILEQTPFSSLSSPSIELKNFGSYSYNAQLIIKNPPNADVTCILHRKKAFLKNFLGFEGEKHDLILPNNEDIKKLFKSKRRLIKNIQVKHIFDGIELKWGKNYLRFIKSGLT